MPNMVEKEPRLAKSNKTGDFPDRKLTWGKDVIDSGHSMKETFAPRCDVGMHGACLPGRMLQAERMTMADREGAHEVGDAPELDETLEAVLMAGLQEAKKKLEAGEDVVPFTALAAKDKLFIETHPAEDVEDCFKAAEHTVAHATGADAYAFCYDGYVETDEGTKDVLIAEGGVPGEPDGHAIGFLYEIPEGDGAAAVVDDEPVYVGPAPNFMAFAVAFDKEGNVGEDE